ncbi:MAG: hypothetical protein KDD45_13675 [Bdellovibrionales bacterium]|nr:hypothetical protein [Bdellovibrionales bacterium]
MKFLIKGFLLVATIASLSACGNSSVVQQVTVTTHQDNNQDMWVSLNSQLNMGSLIFPALTIPIINPKYPSEILGTVNLQRTLDGKNVLAVDANISQISSNQFSSDNLLPNGNAIPVAGLSGVVAVNFNSRSKVYLGGDSNSLMFGVALAIPLFDNIGQYLPGVNMFFALPTNSQVTGLGGVFTGTSGQNGIGLFVQVPNTISSLGTNLAANQNSTSTLSTNKVASLTKLSTVSESSASDVAQKNNASSSMRFISSSGSSKDSMALKGMLYNLSLKRKTLSFK